MLLTREISLHNELITKTMRLRRRGEIGSKANGTKALSFSLHSHIIVNNMFLFSWDIRWTACASFNWSDLMVYDSNAKKRRSWNWILASWFMVKHPSYNDLSRGCRAQIFTHRHPCLIPSNPPKQWAWLLLEWARFYQLLRGIRDVISYQHHDDDKLAYPTRGKS